mgnify:CR=1 FL=1
MPTMDGLLPVFAALGGIVLSFSLAPRTLFGQGGAPLPADAPPGHCPKCLLSLALDAAAGDATQAALELMGIHVLRASKPEEVEEIVSAGFDAAFEAGEKVAVLLGQELIGRKKWERK